MDTTITYKQWREFELNEIFAEIQRGKRLKKSDHKKGDRPYVSSTSVSNGIDGFIQNEQNVRVFSNCLTVANSGSVGATFYHPYSFIASDHVTELKNNQLSEYIYRFIVSLVARLGSKYSFNREINDVRIRREKILLPTDAQGDPDYAFMEAYMKQREQEKLAKYKTFVAKRLAELKDYEEVGSVGDKQWREFELKDLFEIRSGERLTKDDMTQGDTPFIGATDSNNGITSYVGNKNDSLDKNVLGVNYNGSVVENFYHPYSAVFSDDVKRLSLKKAAGNKFLYLFAKTQILKQQSKYQYGYKFNARRMSRQKIMIPIERSGIPDYAFMENYMKKLEYQKLKKYASFKGFDV